MEGQKYFYSQALLSNWPMYVQNNYELVFMLHHNAIGWTKTNDNKLVHFAVRVYSGQVSMRQEHSRCNPQMALFGGGATVVIH